MSRSRIDQDDIGSPPVDEHRELQESGVQERVWGGTAHKLPRGDQDFGTSVQFTLPHVQLTVEGLAPT